MKHVFLEEIRKGGYLSSRRLLPSYTAQARSRNISLCYCKIVSTEPVLTDVDKIRFTVVPPGCSLLNSSPWINGLSRLSVVNNWHNILPANFHLSWKRGKTDCTRSWDAFLNWEMLLENRLNTALDSTCEARNEDWLKPERCCSNRLNLPVDILYLPRQTKYSQAHRLGAVHGGT